MPNNDYIKIDLPIHYSENNVSQCWLCKNCIGKKEFNADLKEKLDMVPVFLPECRVTEQYMLYVHEMPCPHLKVRGGKNNAE